ncbi:hypothetical protein FOL47_005574 [Perkinsus chesapeaki]|uniref:Uncharacterized protein n=1 Tax=Perkinsus chesapeaki TaxID=330153 RepID=A0A7J6LWS6_PERCH|nr:hypothetical protein FOL47_005574 [Perkinsus chesapeaki]
MPYHTYGYREVRRTGGGYTPHSGEYWAFVLLVVTAFALHIAALIVSDIIKAPCDGCGGGQSSMCKAKCVAYGWLVTGVFCILALFLYLLGFLVAAWWVNMYFMGKVALVTSVLSTIICAIAVLIAPHFHENHVSPILLGVATFLLFATVFYFR